MGYMMYSLIPRLLCMGTILCGVVKMESTAHHVLVVSLAKLPGPTHLAPGTSLA